MKKFHRAFFIKSIFWVSLPIEPFPILKDKLAVYNPYNNSLLDEIPLSSEAETLQLLYNLSKHKNIDEKFPKHKRIDVLEKLYQLMQDNKEVLIKTAISEGGKPYNDTIIEFNRALSGVKLCIQSLFELKGNEVPMDLTASSSNKIAFTKHFPIGTVLAISAFNHPINLIVHQVLPAVAVGCTVLVKPSLKTPLSCLLLMNLLYEAGYPKNYASFVVCDNQTTAQLAKSSHIDYLSFIGAANVGWQLRSALSPGVRCALEHGGNAPLILEDCEDLKSVVASIVKGAFYHAGQVCVSVQRVYVCANILDEFTAELVNQTKALKLGNPLDAETDIGPIINENEVIRINTWVQDAVKNGATLLSGGKVKNKTFYEPTILLNPPSNTAVTMEEIFGPVLCVYPYSTIDEAIEKANNSNYAFQASVFTKNIDKAFKAYSVLNAQTLLINEHSAFRTDWMPFGGQKQSGLGMGGILQTMKEYTYEKQCIINY